MTVGEVCAAVDAIAPPALAYSWDKVGLAIGSPDANIRAVLVALGINPNAVRAAKRAKANLIVSHHPVIWEPLNALRTDDPHTAMCLDLAQSNIACYSAHTNLDVVPGGVNTVLADRIGLTNTTPLFSVAQSDQVKLVTFVPEQHLHNVRSAICAAGAGVIGEYTDCSFRTPGVGTFRPGRASTPFSGKKNQINEEPEIKLEVLVLKAKLPTALRALVETHPYEEPAYDVLTLENRDTSYSLGLRADLTRTATLDGFASHVRTSLDVTHVRVTGNGKRKVKHVAVMGGSGGGQIADLPDDVDVFVTGDVKYHEAELAALRGIALIDAGHAGTEKWIVPALATYLRKQVKGMTVRAYVEPDYFRSITK